MKNVGVKTEHNLPRFSALNNARSDRPGQAVFLDRNGIRYDKA